MWITINLPNVSQKIREYSFDIIFHLQVCSELEVGLTAEDWSRLRAILLPHTKHRADNKVFIQYSGVKLLYESVCPSLIHSVYVREAAKSSFLSGPATKGIPPPGYVSYLFFTFIKQERYILE